MRKVLIIPAFFLVSTASCIDLSMDDGMISTPPSETSLYMFEHDVCYADLLHDHDHPEYCDDECCWWVYASCEVSYCNRDDMKECEWERHFNSCG